MNRASHSIVLLCAILLAAAAQAQDGAPPKEQGGSAAPVAPIIPSLRVVGEAPAPAAAPKKKHHRKHCKYGAERVEGKLKCRSGAAPAALSGGRRTGATASGTG